MGVTLKRYKGRGKAGHNVRKKLFCLVARKYGYKGKDIAGHIQKDPAVVTRYLKEREDLGVEVGKVLEEIKRANINNQV